MVAWFGLSRLLLSCLVTVAMSPVVLAQDSVDANSDVLFEQVFGEAADQPALVDIEIDLRIDSVKIGSLTGRVAGSSLQSLERDRVILLVNEILSDALIDSLRSLQPRVTLAQLADAGLPASWAPATLSLDLEVPLSQRRQWRRSIRSDPRPNASRERYAPARISAALNIRPSIALDSDRSSDRRRLAGSGFFSVGSLGLSGTYAYSSGGMGWRRGPLALRHDRPERRLRISLGEVLTPSFGGQQGLGLRGVLIGTNFDLDPYRAPYPGLLTPFILESNSQLEVRVNDRLVDRFRLPAGPVLLEDFPLAPGVNDVAVNVLRDGVLQRVLNTQGWFDRTRLGEGVSAFHVGIGERWLQGPESPLLVPESGTLTASYTRGLSSRLTVGAGAQWQFSREHAIVDLSGEFAMRSASLRVNLMASRSDSKSGAAGAVVMQSNPRPRGWHWQAGLVWRGATYHPLLLENPPGRNISARLRVSRRIGERLSVGLSSGYSKRRGESDGRVRLFASWWATAQLSTQLSLEQAFGPLESSSIGLSLVWRPRTGGHSLTTRSDSRGRWSTGWQVSGVSARRSINAGLFASEDASRRVDAYVSARSSRAAIGARLQRDLDESSSSMVLSGNTALVFADGHFGISERVGEAFVLFAGHPASGRVLVDPVRDDWQVSSGPLGPAVIGNVTPYLERGFSIGLPELPVGLDAGDLQPVAQPAALRGVVVPVGAEPSVSVRFLLFDSDDPLGLATGELVSDTGERTAFFSNRDGEVLVSNLAPGRYQVRLFGRDQFAGQLDIDAAPLQQDKGVIVL